MAGIRGFWSERGFTLIEVLVVVLIIGILAAVALPSFLGQRDNGYDADAKSNAANIRLHVESCATEMDKTFLDCATADQIQAAGLPGGRLDLPPFNLLAAAGGGGGGGGGRGGGPQNGAECIPQSNGARACQQTSDPEDDPPASQDPGVPVETGGSAPDVGYCVEGGTVEVACVGIVATDSGYTITAVSKSANVFRIIATGALVRRECESAGKAGCPGSGRW